MSHLPAIDYQPTSTIDLEPRDNIEPTSRGEFYYRVIDLPTGEGKVICESAGEDGHFFTLMREDPDDVLGAAPTLTLRKKRDSSELIIGNPIGDGQSVPDVVVAEFMRTALTELKCHPESLSLRIHTASLTESQVEQTAKFGFHEPVPRASADSVLFENNNPTDKQSELNKDLESAERLFASYQNGGELRDRTHAEWLRCANSLLKFTLIKEAKDGLEAARQHFEATRAYFVGALRTLPGEIWEVARLDTVSQIEYAGTLARLSSCVELTGYDTDKYPRLAKNNRNEDLFNEAVVLYEELQQSIDEATPDQIKSLVVSGLAQAHALRAEYLQRIAPERNGLGVVIDINHALLRRKQRGQHRRATGVLKDAIKDIDDRTIVRDLGEQLAETEAPEVSLRDGAPDGEKMGAAGKILFELVAV